MPGVMGHPSVGRAVARMPASCPAVSVSGWALRLKGTRTPAHCGPWTMPQRPENKIIRGVFVKSRLVTSNPLMIHLVRTLDAVPSYQNKDGERVEIDRPAAMKDPACRRR